MRNPYYFAAFLSILVHCGLLGYFHHPIAPKEAITAENPTLWMTLKEAPKPEPKIINPSIFSKNQPIPTASSFDENPVSKEILNHPYFLAIKQKVAREFTKNRSKLKFLKHRVDIAFAMNRSGHIQNFKMIAIDPLKPSQYDLLGFILKKTEPFEVFPPEITENEVVLHVALEPSGP